MERRQVRTYDTPDFWEAVRIWKLYKRFGLYGGGGVEGETSEYIDLIDSFEDEYEDVVTDLRK